MVCCLCVSVPVTCVFRMIVADPDRSGEVGFDAIYLLLLYLVAYHTAHCVPFLDIWASAWFQLAVSGTRATLPEAVPAQPPPHPLLSLLTPIGCLNESLQALVSAGLNAACGVMVNRKADTDAAVRRQARAVRRRAAAPSVGFGISPPKAPAKHAASAGPSQSSVSGAALPQAPVGAAALTVLRRTPTTTPLSLDALPPPPPGPLAPLRRPLAASNTLLGPPPPLLASVGASGLLPPLRPAALLPARSLPPLTTAPPAAAVAIQPAATIVVNGWTHPPSAAAPVVPMPSSSGAVGAPTWSVALLAPAPTTTPSLSINVMASASTPGHDDTASQLPMRPRANHAGPRLPVARFLRLCHVLGVRDGHVRAAARRVQVSLQDGALPKANEGLSEAEFTAVWRSIAADWDRWQLGAGKFELIDHHPVNSCLLV